MQQKIRKEKEKQKNRKTKIKIGIWKPPKIQAHQGGTPNLLGPPSINPAAVAVVVAMARL